MERSFLIVIVLGLVGLSAGWKEKNGRAALGVTKDPGDALHEGDILFQSMGGRQGDAITLATNSPWTHVGIAFKEKGEWMIIEAVGPVKTTPLAEWIDQGDGVYAVKRMARSAQGLEATIASIVRNWCGRSMLKRWGSGSVNHARLGTMT